MKALSKSILTPMASTALFFAMTFHSAHGQSMSVEQIKNNLSNNPPNTGSPNIRRQSILSLDTILVSDSARSAQSIRGLYTSMMEKAKKELASDVDFGASVWMMYNDGFLVKTPELVFAFDVTNGYSGWGVQLDTDLVDQIRVLFISHNHGDHADPSIMNRVMANHGYVLFPAEISAIGNVRMAVNDSLDLEGLHIRSYSGLHGDTPLRIYEVVTPDGLRFLHTGDNQTSETLPQVSDIDVLLLNAWVNESGAVSASVGMCNCVNKLAPRAMIPGHIQELAHDYVPGDPTSRLPYQAVYQISDPSVAAKTHTMIWGELYKVSRTEKAAPSAPMLVSPPDKATEVSTGATLAWNASTGATTYRLQVASDSNFTNRVCDNSAITGTSGQIGILGVNTTYWWHVKARNAGGVSGWSNVWRFTTTKAAPFAPTLVSPQDQATDVSTSPSLSWSASPGATTYWLQVSMSSAFSPLVLNDSTITGTTKAIGPLQNSTAYFWRLCARNDRGTSPWSSVRRFTTIGVAPPTPTLSTPQNRALNVPTNPTLSWNASPGAANYTVQVSLSVDMSNAFSQSVTGTSYQLTDLANGYRYYWRVNAGNSAGTSAWSDEWWFITIGVSSVQQIDDAIPSEYSLSQNFPNPFNPTTKIQFDIPQACNVTVKVFTLLGKEVTTLGSEELQPGSYRVEWDARGVASGVYLCRMVASSLGETGKGSAGSRQVYVETKRLMLIK